MNTSIIYTSIPQLLQSCKSLEDQKAMIEMILMNMLAAINTATATGQFEEYQLDTGQTKTEIRYRNITQLQKAYDGLFNSWNKLNNQLNRNRQGRKFRLIDEKNFPRIGYGQW